MILHHAAVAHGASGVWYYRPGADEITAVGLSLVAGVTQSWFMGV